jgi:uncharacterized protein DUF6281
VSAPLGPRRLVAAIVLGVVAVAFQTGTDPASATCAFRVNFLQAPYLGAGAIPAADLGGEAGPGTIPACDDTPGAGPVEQPQPVTFLRVGGVAPRFAVALPAGPGAMANLVVAEGIPCRLGAIAESLGCLRQRTTRLIAGPALLTYPSARAGEVIQLGVHVRDRSLRARVIYGLDALLQRLEGQRWRSVYHLPYSLSDGLTPPAPVPVGTPGYALPSVGLSGARSGLVQLPLVEPGQSRIAKQVIVGSRR